MVMTELIEPGLKPVPLEGIFLCSIVLIVFNNLLRCEVKSSFKILAFLYTCFRFKYDVFRKRIISFEAVNRN